MGVCSSSTAAATIFSFPRSVLPEARYQLQCRLKVLVQQVQPRYLPGRWRRRVLYQLQKGMVGVDTQPTGIYGLHA